MSQLEQLVQALEGRYRVDREIGAGGMATVFLAEDIKHHRKVAVKVLRPDLTASIGAARFLREIEIGAQLQHPNILPILDSGEENGLLYYVMPFVEGQSLRERLAREGELPVTDAIRLLSEIADALAHAHARGVVHRDIKPDNVMLSGRHAIVTDFGVAKALSEATGERRLTTGGIALGTPSYMSPEQAAADPHADHRTDIYALGAVAYELLAGRPPFVGTTPQQVLAAHMTEAPESVARRRSVIPAQLDALVMKCLEKRPADRWQTADEVVSQLEMLATPTMGLAPTQATIPAEPRTAGRTPWLIAAAGVAAAGLLVFAVSRGGGERPLDISLGTPVRVTADDGLEVHPALSPDGRSVAYAAGNSLRLRVYVRDVAGGRARPLTDDSTAIEQHPRWSPGDSTSILFLSRGGVFVAPSGGGRARQIVPSVAGVRVSAADWSPAGDEIAFERRDSLFVVGVAGGEPRFLGRASGVNACAWSPSGRWIACTSGNSTNVFAGRSYGNLASSSVVVFPATGGAPVQVTDSVGQHQSPAWLPPNDVLLYTQTLGSTSDVFAIRISSRGEREGEPTRLTTGARAQTISVSRDGKRLALAEFTQTANIWSAPIGVGIVTRAAAAPLTTGPHNVEALSLTPDRRALVFDSDLHGNADIYRVAVSGGEPERLTSDSLPEFAPKLSPDGSAVVAHSFRAGTRDIIVQPLDGRPREWVTTSSAEESYPSWAPDGRAIAFVNNIVPYDVHVMHRSGDGSWSTPRWIAEMTQPQWSPDGRLIAGVQGGSIAVIPADSGTVRTVHDPPPGQPRASLNVVWSNDGRTIYYKTLAGARSEIWSVPLAGGPARRLLQFTDPAFQPLRGWTTDGTTAYFAIQDRQSDIWVVDVQPSRPGGN